MIVASPVISRGCVGPPFTIESVAAEATEAATMLPAIGAIAPPAITLPAVAPNPADAPTIAAFFTIEHPVRIVKQRATKQPLI